MESLYRKYRPLTFEGVVGQQHIVSTLEHAVAEGRISHAYLFCGPRGTGKTTMARILAKALLCEKAPAAREAGASGCMPDGTCAECQAIAEGTHPDVYELDAASRTGVDNVREEIIGSVMYAPVRGAFKVYIIDEVHMLTQAAFNALLKTLEEPPAHVVFVMCTTDPQKIPETILSRCQRFEFHRIGNDDIVRRLADVCSSEGFSFDEEALAIVAKHARGGMRDALSTLEQLSVFGGGEVRLEDARALLGEVPGAVLAQFARGIAARDVAGLFGLVRTQVEEGNDLMELTRDLVAHMRDVYMVRIAGAGRGVVDATPDEEAALAAEAGLFEGADRLARSLTVLDDAALEMRTAADTRLVLEIALTRLARPESDLTLEALADRLDRVEALLAKGAAPAPAPAEPASAPAPSAPAAAKGVPATVPTPAPAATGTPEPAVSGPFPAPTPEAAPKTAPASFVPFRADVAPAAPAASPEPAVESESKPDATSATTLEPSLAPVSEPESASQEVPAPETVSAPAPVSEQASASQEVPEPVFAPAPSAAEVAASSAAPTPAITDAGELQRRWDQVVKAVSKADPPRGGLLLSTRALSDDGAILTVGLPARSNFAAKMLAREDARSAILPVVASVFGARRLEFAMGQGGGSAAGAASGTAPASPSAPVTASAAPSPAPEAPAGASPSAAEAPSKASAPKVEVPAAASAPKDEAPAAPPAVDRSSGPTILPEPDLEADRARWEEEQVPYGEIDEEPVEVDELPPFDAVPASSAPAAPAPIEGINYVDAPATEEAGVTTKQEAGDMLDAIFGGHRFLDDSGDGA